MISAFGFLAFDLDVPVSFDDINDSPSLSWISIPVENC